MNPSQFKGRKLMKIIPETNEIKKIGKVNKTKSWFLEIYDIDEPLERLTKEKIRHKLSLSGMKWDITGDPVDINRIIRE